MKTRNLMLLCLISLFVLPICVSADSFDAENWKAELKGMNIVGHTLKVETKFKEEYTKSLEPSDFREEITSCEYDWYYSDDNENWEDLEVSGEGNSYTIPSNMVGKIFDVEVACTVRKGNVNSEIEYDEVITKGYVADTDSDKSFVVRDINNFSEKSIKIENRTFKDLTGDGKVDLDDATYLVAVIDNLIVDEDAIKYGDVNCDGELNLKDHEIYRKVIAGLTSFDNYCKAEPKTDEQEVAEPEKEKPAAKEKTTDNPDTGVFYKYGIVALLGVLASAGYVVTRKNKKFPKRG